LSSPEPQRCCILHHVVVLLPDQPQINRPREHGLEAFVSTRLPGIGSVEPLGMDSLEPREQSEAEQPTKCKGDLALAVAVDVLSIDHHLGKVPDDAFDHRGDFGR